MNTWNPILLAFQLWQYILARALAPEPPPPGKKLHRPRIAIIGAGLTGVAAASHCVGHGFEVTVFEAGPREQLGGIWSRVNSTSGLQIHSVMYRFFPTVFWNKGYPNRKEIVDQVKKVWETYDLESRTKFNFKVNKIKSDGHGRWYVNDKTNGRFDGVIAAIGSCGDAKMPHLPGQEKFKGEIYHSSELDGKHVKGKDVLIIGGGASAIEAMEFVAKNDVNKVKILARSEKWIIPRNAIVDMLLALNVFGMETVFSWIPERLLKLFFYRDLEDIAPPSGSGGLYTETPMVNSNILGMIRSGTAEWLRGDIVKVEEEGIRFNRRAQGVPKNGPGHESVQKGQVIIMATGYGRPSLEFLPDDCFEEPYMPPNWYLQTFPPAHMTICANNCTYVNGIGSVGNFHIGIYTRVLLMFLIDPLTRPSEFWMKKWIDMTRFIKSKSPTGAFDFFTYSELIWWFLFCVTINPFRWKWAIWVFTGIGLGLPLAVVDREDHLRNGIGKNDKDTTVY
ncbi:FAD/NAD(P)-binding domain-containing protein [Myriangium duriaei CBS 260.36]|uniref:FAD/NAD(P)-binding domain-containing protein n=1 Tax=Myriangium duriaei CBS 260.36 TaxID=1168546 RepID=A0A9P4MGT7_9PEZI|nr:FAD/NAD(P)-binding domain-containing protein [Myriangium duriaei CBS 260.36]